jgi:hypothetical protein
LELKTVDNGKFSLKVTLDIIANYKGNAKVIEISHILREIITKNAMPESLEILALNLEASIFMLAEDGSYTGSMVYNFVF